MENVIISNGKFNIDDKTGEVTIDRSLSCKICDFGLAEIFKVNGDDKKEKKYFQYDVDEEKLGPFHINNKYSIAALSQCPQQFDEEVYDARKADIWSFGVILFYMAFGIQPYEKQLSTDTGFWSIKHQKIDLFLVCTLYIYIPTLLMHFLHVYLCTYLGYETFITFL